MSDDVKDGEGLSANVPRALVSTQRAQKVIKEFKELRPQLTPANQALADGHIAKLETNLQAFGAAFDSSDGATAGVRVQTRPAPGQSSYVAPARALLKEAMLAEMTVGSPEHKTFAKKLLTQDPQTSADQLTALLEGLRQAIIESPLSEILKESVTRDVMTFGWGSMVWGELGCPVFNLTLDFFRALLVTDFGDVGEEVMKLPFPAFIINCPEALAGDTRRLFIYPVTDVLRDVDHHHVFRMTLDTKPERAERQAFTQWDDGLTFNRFLHGTVKAIESTDEVEKAATLELGTTMDPAATATARRVLGNLLLYVNSNGGLPTEKRLGADVPVEREHQTEPRFRVGRPVKLGPAIRQALSYAKNRGDPLWKLSQRFIVRGHWRMQVHGKGRTERKRIWIAPFYKGPTDLTEALERTYEVE